MAFVLPPTAGWLCPILAPGGVSAEGQGTVPAGFGAAGGTAGCTVRGAQGGGRQELHRSHGEMRCGAGQKRGVGLAEKDMDGIRPAVRELPARGLAALQTALLCSSFVTDGAVPRFP